MSLATIIRLEFAYPGVGVLAGDSIQYLSIATAHGVIMVFYMIMPVVFGAFGNFLLPTQLGVHDVAFPRLNSAAFWFLPGGLIMLCQLVCVDRRYQRMNCFNIRELQGILKRKFFTDLINSNDHRQLLDKSIIGLRFKNNGNLGNNPDMSLFYNFGTTSTSKGKSLLFTSNYSPEFTNTSLLTSTVKAMTLAFTPANLLSSLMTTYTNFLYLLKNITLLPFSLNFTSLTTLTLTPSFVADLFVLAAPVTDLGATTTSNYATSGPITYEGVAFNSDTISSESTFSSSMSEFSTSLRFTRFNNPLISYDYKCGNYLGI